MDKKTFSLFVSTLLFVLLLPSLSRADGVTDERWLEEVRTLTVARTGLESVVRFLQQQPDLLSPSKNGLLNHSGREELLSAWQRFLDHLLALDAIGTNAERQYKLGSGAAKKQSFELAFAVFLTEYRQSLALIDLIETNRDLHIVLNEPRPELGLDAGTYAALKFRFLNLLRAAEFSRLQVVYHAYGKPENDILRTTIDEDIRYIWSIDGHKGPTLTLKNAMRILQDTAFTTWLPVQKGVSEWMGDTRVRRSEENLVSAEQIEELKGRLEPGDILLVRREWYLSNIALPGFWPHAALYIGTPEERASYFNDEETHRWIRGQGEASGELEKLLHANHFDTVPDETGETPHPLRVIEAISEGVSFTTLEHAAGGDSVAVLRPRLPRSVKARALVRAFHFAGRPYDFDFNFLTDSALVCTELVYKAYEPGAKRQGLHLPVEKRLGRPIMPANAIARLFDKEFGGQNPQFEFVAFLDGKERAKKAVTASVDDFRQSWRRPKWHVYLQEPSHESEALIADRTLKQ